MTLPDDLEMMMMGALLQNQLAPDKVNKKHLSRMGVKLYETYIKLGEDTTPKDVFNELVINEGQDNKTLEQYISRAYTLSKHTHPLKIYERWAKRQTLLEIQNEVTKQLGGDLVTEHIEELLVSVKQTQQSPAPLGGFVTDELPVPPVGVEIVNFESLTKWTGGLQFMWAIGGEPGIGKSTLAFQFAMSWLHSGRTVIYYDRENSPTELIRRGADYHRDPGTLRCTLGSLHYRDSLSQLRDDLKIDAPDRLLIVVDSIQKVPTKVEYRRQGIDYWIGRFEEIKKSGATVLLLSELSKGSYDNPNLAAYKETGEVEYSVDVGIQLRECKQDDRLVECRIVKDRPRPYKGSVCYLKRKSFGIFVEESASQSEW